MPTTTAASECEGTPRARRAISFVEYIPGAKWFDTIIYDRYPVVPFLATGLMDEVDVWRPADDCYWIICC